MASITKVESTPQVTFSGIASGIDTESIIKALVDVSSRPIGLLERKKTDLEQARQIWTNLDEKVDDLESKLRPLRYSSRFLAHATSVSDENVMTVSASGSATVGSYSVTVGRLATSASVGSQEYADSDTLTVGNGTLRLTVGTTTTDVTVDSSNDTLDGLAQAINNSDAEVTASVVATEPGGPFRLVIRGNETGDDSAVSLDATGVTGGDQDLSFSTLQAAQNSQITVNGLTVERSSNTVSDVIDGLTFSLVSAGSSAATVSLDVDSVKETLQGFIDAYNGVYDVIAGQLRYDRQSDAAAPPLLGDFSLRGIQRQFQSAVMNPVTLDDGSKLAMSLLGVTTGSDGRLEVDETKFANALEEDFDHVTEFFTKPGTGFAAKVQGILDEVTDPVDGTIAGRKESIRMRITGLNDRIEVQQNRLDRYETQLRKYYAAFETRMGDLQSQMSFLQMQLQQQQQR